MEDNFEEKMFKETIFTKSSVPFCSKISSRREVGKPKIDFLAKKPLMKLLKILLSNLVLGSKKIEQHCISKAT